jgi:HK97 family phage prohead protease
MSDETATTELGSIELRDDASGDGRSISGYALRWSDQTAAGGTKEYGSARESFRRGAFAQAIAAIKRLPIIDRHGDAATVVGYADQLTEDEVGLRFGGRLLTSQAARDYAERVANGIDGVSVEFLPGQVLRQAGAVQHTAVRRLVAIAGSYMPAYAGASAAVRDQEVIAMDETTAAVEPITTAAAAATIPQQQDVRGIVREEVAELRRSLAESALANAGVDQYAALRGISSLGELMVATRDNAELRHVMARALTDQIGANNPGVMTPGVLQDVKGIVNAARPAISSWGAVPLDGSGMSVDFPYFDGNLGTLVAAQATQKTEITSVRVDIKKGTAAVQTLAGGSDIAYQLIRRSSPAYLEAYGRIMLSAYAAVSDGTFTNAIEGTAGLGSITLDWTTATLDLMREALFLASTQVQDLTGSPAAFVQCGATVFVEIGGKLNPQGESNGQVGDASAASLSPVISGLRVIYNPAVNAGAALVSNSTTAAWFEDGPYQVSDEDVAKLGRDVAVWGLGAPAVYQPAAIIVIKP